MSLWPGLFKKGALAIPVTHLFNIDHNNLLLSCHPQLSTLGELLTRSLNLLINVQMIRMDIYRHSIDIQRAPRRILTSMTPRLLDKSVPLSTNSSPINHLLLTNNPPLESEESIIRHIISITELKQTETDKLINQLVNQRNDTQKIIDSHKAILSPIRRLPPELIAEIAFQTLAPHGLWVGLNTNTGPWRLAQICRIWRNVVTNLPKLWSSLRFFISSKSPVLVRNPEEIMAALLHRSGTSPLSIEYTEECTLEEVVYPTQIMQMLVGQCHRWERLDLTLTSDSMGIIKLNDARGKLPVLERLHLTIEAEYVPATHTIDAFSIAPRLRGLLVQNESNIIVELPLEQLETFAERHELHLPHALLFPRLLNVAICDLTQNLSLPTSFLDTDGPQSLPRVRDLTIEGTDVFSLLTTPKLEYLEVTTRSDSLMPLASMFRRSKCALTSLIINLNGEVDAAIISVLREVPSLTYLQLWEAGYDPDLIDGLAISAASSDSALLPNLESLTLVFAETAYGDFKQNELMHMIESRLDYSASFEPDTRSNINTIFISIAFLNTRLGFPYSRLTSKMCERRKKGVRILVDYRCMGDHVDTGIIKDTYKHRPIRDYEYCHMKYI